METILLIVLIFAVGFYIGKTYAYLMIAKELRDAAKEAGLDLEKELAKLEAKQQPQVTKVPKLSVERHGDMLYLFDRETDTFVCQGASVQELAEHAKKYKNIANAVVLFGDKVFAFTNGESIEVVV